MPQQLMLDPSLLLSSRTFGLVSQGWQRKELDGTILPPSFGAAAIRGELSRRSLNFFGGRDPSDPREVAAFVERSGLLEGIKPERRELPDDFVRHLADAARDDLLLSILIEEWTFLTSRSWIASRLRRPFTAFLQGGAVAVEWGGKRLDEVTARTLKIPVNEMPVALTRGQRVRAAAKWIAVGGSSVSALIHPIAAAVVSTATGVFFLLESVGSVKGRDRDAGYPLPLGWDSRVPPHQWIASRSFGPAAAAKRLTILASASTSI
jgi:hypothetical protein